MPESGGPSAVDRGLLRRLDWAHADEANEATPPVPLAEPSSTASFDITAILGAVQLTATSMSTMAERIRELEDYADAFTASNEELEAYNRQLTIELGEVVQQRDDLTASLQTQSERLKRLEIDTAGHIARATALERDLGAAHLDLTKIVDTVESRLPIDASARAEDPPTS